MDEFDVYLDFSLQARSRFEVITSVLDNAAQDWISPKTFGARGRRVTGTNSGGIEISPVIVRKYPCPSALA
jgi:hypothetical protein